MAGAVAVVAATVVFAVVSGTGAVSARSTKLFSNHAMTVLPAVAAALSFAVAFRRRGRDRMAWTLLGVWGVLSASGNAVWEYYELIRGVAVPFPSLADAGYLGGNLTAIAAIAAFGVASHRASRGRTVLDAVLIAGSIFIVSWSVLLRDLFTGSSGTLLEQVIGLAYPVIDVVVMSMVVFMASRSSGVARGPMLVIGVGFAGWALSDSAFAFLTSRDLYNSGGPADAGWIGGDALIVLAALVALIAPRRLEAPDEPAIPGFRLRLPYITAGLAIAVGGTMQLLRGVDPLVLTGFVVLLVVVVARQFMSLLEQQQVTIDRLQSIDEMKNGILNAVSHELRTPLTYIKGNAYLLRDGGLPPETATELVDDLVKGADRLEETLTGLLDLGRLARGVLEPSRRPTEIAALLLQVADSLRCDDHVINVHSDGVVANIDPVHVERIVENLFTNAVRHTPAGTDVSAEAHRTPEGLVISVADTGPGVPEDMRERIFEPFVQSGHTESFGRGTGVGLAIVKRFAELHGGRAWVEANVVGGATFCVLLPDEKHGRRPELSSVA